MMDHEFTHHDDDEPKPQIDPAVGLWLPVSIIAAIIALCIVLF